MRRECGSQATATRLNNGTKSGMQAPPLSVHTARSATQIPEIYARNSCNRIHGYPINRIWTTAHAGTPLPCPAIDAESRRQPTIRAPGTSQNRAVGPDDRLLGYRTQNRNRRIGSTFAYRYLGIQIRLWLDLRRSTWNKNRSFVYHSRFVKRPI